MAIRPTVEVKHLLLGLVLDGSFGVIYNHVFLVEGRDLVSILNRVSVGVAGSAETSLYFDILVSLEFFVILPFVGDVMTSNEITSRNSLLSTSLVPRGDDLHFKSSRLRERVRLTRMVSPLLVLMASITFFIVDTLVLL
jgi:hypothetical protein